MKRQRFKHSIIFGDGTLVNGQFVGLDTYMSFHLVPSSRPTIASPGVESKFVTIPGRDGSIDLSEFLHSGRPAYGDRGGSFEFYVENDWDIQAVEEEFWMTLYPKLFNLLHGRKFKMVLKEDDPDYYWEGRFTVDKYDPDDGTHSKVTISYALSPFKRRIRKISEGFVWDNLNFDQDYEYSPLGLSDYTATSYTTLDIWGDGYPFPIEVTSLSGSAIIHFGGEFATVENGETAMIGHAVYGNNQLTITPIGNSVRLKIDWRGGSL